MHTSKSLGMNETNLNASVANSGANSMSIYDDDDNSKSMNAASSNN